MERKRAGIEFLPQLQFSNPFICAAQYVLDLRYFKLWILLDKIILVRRIKGLHHQVAKIKESEYLIRGKNSIPLMLRLEREGEVPPGFPTMGL